MYRLTVVLVVAAIMSHCGGKASGQPAASQALRSTVSQPSVLQPLRPLTPQTVPNVQPANNYWGGVPNLFGNMQFGAAVRNPAAANRSIFRGLNVPQPQQNQAASQTGGATVAATARFLRANRAAGTFVGTDSRDVLSPVGSVGSGEAGIGTAPGTAPLLRSPTLPLSSVQGAPPPPQRPAGSPARAAMYEPRLRVGFDVPQRGESEFQAHLTNLLRSCPQLRQTSPIEVSLEGRTATLRGTVASERDRVLAQQLILFEPGISQVINELTVRPPDTPPSSPPASP